MTPGFQSRTARVETFDGHNFTLVDSVVYVTGSGEVITIISGAKTDGASTPRALWTLGIPPFGPYWLATVLHDYLYRSSQKTRSECDDLLLEAMLSLGVSHMIARLIYEGVRLGGASSFDDDRSKQTPVQRSFLLIQPATP